MKTRKLIPLILSYTIIILSCFSCKNHTYDNHDLELLTRYKAKDFCSCMFVMKRDEDYCRDWTVAAPNLASIKVDQEEKTVTTQAIHYWSATARYTGERTGCTLDEREQ